MNEPFSRKVRPTALLLAALLTSAPLTFASAAPLGVLKVATSPNGSTASAMYTDLGRACTSSAWLQQRQTSGSTESLELLLGNEVSLAFVQLDVLKARQQIDKDPRVNRVRALLPLNFDEIHVLARVPQKTFLGKTKGVRAFSELGGKRVGAWGGSVVTAQILRAKAGVNFQVLPFPGRDQTLAALRAGQVDAVLAVVGQPADWVKALTPQEFALLPLDVPAGQLSGFYQPARLVYGQFGAAVSTYGVQRILATENFKLPERRKQLLAYQACAKKKLTELQETEGYHPKWREVDFAGNDWPLYR